MSTLADLSGHDLGRLIEFTDGGGTYRGGIESVWHRIDYQGKPTDVTIVLRSGDWNHQGQHSPETTFQDVAP